MNIDNPVLVLVGLPLLAIVCWLLSQFFPLLANETRAHASSLALDGLRGVLAPAVFFHHAYLTYIFLHTGVWQMPTSIFYGQIGPSAVTIFFFISGYLFWGKMLRNPDSLHIRSLWPNRLRRLAPAYWAAVLFAFGVTALATSFQLHQSIFHLFVAAIQWMFFGFPTLPDLNGLAQERITGGVFWSLRMEVLFYLLLPALSWFRRGSRFVWMLLLASAAFLAVHRFHSRTEVVDLSIENARRFLLNLCTTFSFGMLAAYHPWSEKISSFLRSRWSAILSLLLLVIQLGWMKPEYTWHEPLLLLPLFAAVVEGNSLFGILTRSPLRCLGQISYSFYIFHGILLFLMTTLWNDYDPIASMGVFSYWEFILCTGMVVVIFSTLTYWFIERPFLRPAKPQNSLPLKPHASAS